MNGVSGRRSGRLRYILQTLSLLLASGLVCVSSALADTTVSGTISTNTTWGLGGSPYVFAGDVTVASGVTLTLEPGVVVKLDSGDELDVDGTLLADGTSGQPIVFTSIKDDTAGGDTNGDGGATTPAAGDWYELNFSSPGSGSVLDYVEVRYAGAFGQSIDVYTSGLSITNSTIVDGSSYGIDVHSVSPTIADSTIARHSSYGIYLVGSSASITGNTIQDNSHGIYLSNSPGATITGNTITGHASYGLYADPDSAAVTWSGNVMSDNGYTEDGLVVRVGTLTQSATWGTTDALFIFAGDVTVVASPRNRYQPLC